MLDIGEPRGRDKAGQIAGVAVDVFLVEDAGQGVGLGLADWVGIGLDNSVSPEGASAATASTMLPVCHFCSTQTHFLAIHFSMTTRASLIC